MTRTPSLHTNKGLRCKERGGCESCNKIILYHLTIENLMRPEKKTKERDHQMAYYRSENSYPWSELSWILLQERLWSRDSYRVFIVIFILSLSSLCPQQNKGWFLIKCLQIATCLWCSTDRISYGNCNLLLKFENYLVRPFNLSHWDMGHGWQWLICNLLDSQVSNSSLVMWGFLLVPFSDHLVMLITKSKNHHKANFLALNNQLMVPALENGLIKCAVPTMAQLEDSSGPFLIINVITKLFFFFFAKWV